MGRCIWRLKTEGVIQRRAASAIRLATIIWLGLFIAGGIWVDMIDGYTITSPVSMDGISNPQLKTGGCWKRRMAP